MRLLIVSLIVWLMCVIGTVTPVLAFEQIDSFTSEITINQDTSLSIKEVIQYRTDLEKHGIYRYIPFRYRRNGLNYTAAISQEKITNEKGQTIPFERSMSDGNVTFKIGDPDRTFTGVQTYVISYRVKDALQRYEGFDELYWDITGEGWQIPIASTTATIRSPHAQVTEAACFSGVFGSDDTLCRIVSQTTEQVSLLYPQVINYNDNVTVGLKLNQANALDFPTPTEKNIQRFLDNANLVILILPALIMGGVWWRKGRDKLFISPNVFEHDEAKPQRTAPLFWQRRAPFVYEPIKDLTPGEAGALMDEKVDNEDVVAEIIELARKKYLKIERVETKKFLGLAKDTDYVFTFLKDSDGKLSAAQSYLHEHIFSGGETSVKMSSLKGTFYTEMEQTKKLIFESLTDKKLFSSNPQTVKGVGLGVAIAMLAGAFIWMFQVLERGQWLGIPLMILSTPFTLLFANALPAKTAKGSNLGLQAKGLKETIARGQWREKIKEKHLFVEEVLPFAIALGVVDQLARDMEALNLKPPQYIGGSSAMMHNYAFHSLVSDFSHQVSSNMAYNPSSSSSGGSFSGGGSSGGGGGGGGGGSW
jgi:uncharacterized membrane protein